MTILPLEAAGSRTPGALRDFLGRCQSAAAAEARAKLVSISLEVDALDPLAVLESIFEPSELHFYVERPGEGMAVAGAEAAAAFTAVGPGRFAAARAFIDETLGAAVAVGDLSVPFSGPHFFSAFAFSDTAEPGEPFPPATVFVPRWQVAHVRGRTVAVANLLVDGNTPVDALADRVWRAHAKFRSFDYAEPDFPGGAGSPPTGVSEVGAAGGYARAVASALEGIARGDFEKIVLARAKDLSAPGILHPLRVLNGLRQRFSDCYAFSVANGRGQSFIGASPERLVRVEGGRLTTEALAGSASRGASASEDAALAAALLRDDKELREHRLVLDFIAGRLTSLGLQPEFPERPFVRKFANVQHLHTPVGAALPSSVGLADVLAALCPTPAVGGAPREVAVPLIRGLEGFPRGLYAGALGWFDPRGGGEFFVGLRSALIDGARARLYAGAGIVAGSSPAGETAETEMKFGAMQQALLPGF
jgi:menaquinone-specific isochorismate synthase